MANKDPLLATDDVEKAKQIASGPLGLEHASFAGRCVRALLIDRPGAKSRLNSASASLLEIDGRRFAITCNHVLAPHLDALTAGAPSFLQIGSVRVDVRNCPLETDEQGDYAVIDVTGAGLPQRDIGTTDAAFMVPRVWPPPEVEPDDHVYFAGFPGVQRKQTGSTELTFGAFAASASVASVGPGYFWLQFSRKDWVVNFGPPEAVELEALGGMSGGPVLIPRQHVGLTIFDFAGIITDYHETFDLMKVTSASSIRLPSLGM